MGSNTQVCWHKFARYWDVEPREVPLEGNEVVTDPERAAAACDENTIGVVSVLGSTFTGHYENVLALSAALDQLQEKDRPRYSHSRRWRQRRICRAVPAAGAGLGFPPAAREIHQHLGPQIRPGLSGRGLDRVARAAGSRSRPDLQCRLPRRRHAHAGHQLLPAGQPDRGPVLQPHPAGQVGLSRHPRGVPGGGRRTRRPEIAELGPFQMLSTGTISRSSRGR
jgi:hypothetical protein